MKGLVIVYRKQKKELNKKKEAVSEISKREVRGKRSKKRMEEGLGLRMENLHKIINLICF